jgi:hypothetical protein
MKNAHVRFCAPSLAVFLVLLAAVSANAQKVNSSGLSGTLVSAGVADNSSGPAVVYTTPATGHFVLTQAGGANALFSVPGFGQLGGTGCPPTSGPNGTLTFAGTIPLTFSPGLVLPPNTAISCSPVSACGGGGCYITGVLTK